jgi:hypothetical protein
VVKSRRMRRAGRVERMGKREIYKNFLTENLKGTDHSEDLGLDDWII